MGIFLNTSIAIVYTAFVLGSIFAASSVSLSLIYGTMRFLNLAHGSFLVIGGYVAWVFANYFGLPLYLAILFATGFGFALGLFTYLIMLKPLLGIGSPKWDIATIGWIFCFTAKGDFSWIQYKSWWTFCGSGPSSGDA